MPVSGAPHVSWTPSPGAPLDPRGVPRNALGQEAVRARSVSIQPTREPESQRYIAPQQRAPRYSEAKKYGPGLEVEIGEHRFRCLDVLGKGSYSEVWRGEVLKGGAGAQEVALKEVRCGSQVELQQAIFEVQVLLALVRSTPSSNSFAAPPRVPRCISYQVDPCNNGWKVRTAMTVVPGESLDVFIRHKPAPTLTRETATRRAVNIAAKLIRDIAPTLQLLAPIAWHRDVNSHNILIDTTHDDTSDVQGINEKTSFWLIDFGLAVDSQSWVTMHGRWRTEDIGGDSRYWPPSSWIMHLLGPEGFQGRQELCDQYQRRLDIHGLGITALELLCTIANASPASESQSKELAEAWEQIFTVWHKYRVDVWRWWAAVYSVFSAGGDIAPVQAQMNRDRVVDQLIVLLSDIRAALRHCIPLEDESAGYVLSTIADMVDEMCTFELTDVPAMLGDKVCALPMQAASLSASSSAPLGRTVSSLTLRQRPRSPSPHRPQDLLSASSSALPRQASMQQVPPWQTQEPKEPLGRAVSRQVSPPPLHKGPIVLRQLSPSRGRSPTGARPTGIQSPTGGPMVVSLNDLNAQASSTPTPRESQRAVQSSSRSFSGAEQPSSRAEPSSRILAPSRSVALTMADTPGRSPIAPRANSIDPHRRLSNGADRSASPQRWGQPLSGSRPWTGVMLPATSMVMAQQQRQASATRDRQPSQPAVEVLTRDQQQLNHTPQGSPSLGTRKLISDSRLSRSGVVLPAPPTGINDEDLIASKKMLGVPLGQALGSGAVSASNLHAYSMERGVSSSNSFNEGQLLGRSPRELPSGQLRTAAGGPLLSGSQLSASQTHLHQRGLQPIWLPPPREARVSRPSAGGLRSSEDGRIHDGRDATTMASRLTEAMAGLSAAVAAAQTASATQSAPAEMQAHVLDTSMGNVDVGAGPSYALTSLDTSVSSYPVTHTVMEGGMMSPSGGLGRANEQVRRSIITNQELKDRMQSLESSGDEHEKLRERIKNLEESLQRLGRESLERAKLGMEKLAEKYFPKVRPAGPGQLPMPQNSSGGVSPAMVLPNGLTAGMPQVRSTYSLATGMPPSPNSIMQSPLPVDAVVMTGGIASL